MSSAQSEAATDVQASQARLANNLQEIVFPGLRTSLQQIMSELGNSRVDQIYGQAKQQVGQSADQAGWGTQAGIQYHQNAWGAGAPGTVGTGLNQEAQFSIQQDRSQALRNLEFEQASAKLNRFNQLQSLLGQEFQTGMGIGGGLTQNQLGAISGMQGGGLSGALGGAASGAVMGISAGGGPWGAVGGGLLGGLLGYYQGGR